MKRLAAVIVTLWAGLASATTVTRDYTDQWYKADESGWGANVTQQGEVLFITLFVYGLGSVPTWYVAPSTTLAGTSSQFFSGPLYATTGPYIGEPWNQTPTATQVGTLSFEAHSQNTGTIRYNVGGVMVAKSIIRQTWRNDSLAGNYLGATVGTVSGCASGNGSFESPASYNITQLGAVLSISETGQGYTCSYSANYAQTGRTALASGSRSCTPGGAQSFEAGDIIVSRESISMRVLMTSGSCRFEGRLGGMRRN